MALVESQPMQKGTPIIPFLQMNHDGYKYALKDFLSQKLLMLVFTCNHCPYAKASWPILIDLQTRYESEGLQIVGINTNHAAREQYPDDDFREMDPLVNEYGINFPYVVDEEQKLARAYNAACTPDPFLFRFDPSVSTSFSLFYHGRLNDNWKEPEKVKEKSMELFILAALEKGSEPEKVYPSMGCSIKWAPEAQNETSSTGTSRDKSSSKNAEREDAKPKDAKAKDAEPK